MNVHCASCGADLDAHRNRALIFSLIPHIARKLTLFMAIFIDRGLKLLNAIWIRSPSPEYTTSGDYRSSAADGSAQGPSSLLTVAQVSYFFHVLMNSYPTNHLKSTKVMTAVHLFALFAVQLSGVPKSSKFHRYPSAALLA